MVKSWYPQRNLRRLRFLYIMQESSRDGMVPAHDKRPREDVAELGMDEHWCDPIRVPEQNSVGLGHELAQLGTDHDIKTQQQLRKVFQVYPF
jgi:hypothetical protein